MSRPIRRSALIAGIGLFAFAALIYSCAQTGLRCDIRRWRAQPILREIYSFQQRTGKFPSQPSEIDGLRERLERLELEYFTRTWDGRQFFELEYESADGYVAQIYASQDGVWRTFEM